MLLVGWPRRFKHVGAAYPAVCSACDQDTYYHLVKSRRWLTLWFLPVLPLGAATWSLVCAHCERTMVIEGSEELQNAKRAADITSQHTDYVLDSEEYWPEIERLASASGLFRGPEEEIPDPDQVDQFPADRSFQ